MQGVILLILMFFPFMYGFRPGYLGQGASDAAYGAAAGTLLTSIGVAIAANMKSMEGYR